MVICYIAQSLDGFIATPDGGLDWLPAPNPAQDYGYQVFLDSVDAILLGRTTYEQVLGFGPWPYSRKTTRIFSHRQTGASPALPPGASWTSQKPDSVLQRLYAEGCKRLWLVGGSQLIASFRKEHLIDEYIITTIPVILGDGVPLFLDTGAREVLCCTGMKKFPDGIVQGTYQQA